MEHEGSGFTYVDHGGHSVNESSTLLSSHQLRGRTHDPLNNGQLAQRHHEAHPFKERMMNFQDSGYSEDDPEQQMVTTCLMQTASGSLYMQPKNPTTPTLDPHYSQPVFATHTRPSTECSIISGRGAGQHKQKTETIQKGQPTPSMASMPTFKVKIDLSNPRLWKWLAVFFIVITIALTATLVFVTLRCTLLAPSEAANAKAFVVLESLSEDVLSKQLETDNARKSPDSHEMKSPSCLSCRSLPPDGTTFQQIELGQLLVRSIPPFGYLNIQFFHKEASYVSFSLSIQRGTSFGLYARQNGLPTHTHYNFMEVITGFKDQSRSKRASYNVVKKIHNYFMEEGYWFMSLYNDDGDTQEVEFSLNSSKELTEGCPNGCHGNGDCVQGTCQCAPGYDGEHCSQSICPLLCSGQGDYINGECQCKPGWKGKECNVRYKECEVPDCNGHGQCEDGKCICMKGYKGEFCQNADCPDPLCSGHGFCLGGECFCKTGWLGPECSQVDPAAQACLPGCGIHGNFDIKTQTCACDPGWTGKDCAVQLCNLDCGDRGRCEDMVCKCQEGWFGHQCQSRDCDPRCGLHGQCKNGTCLCVTGWNGRHCTLEGCPKQCSGNGECRTNFRGEWSCQCEVGWDGKDCGTMLEFTCDDGLDNDGDGLRDCEDPECCEHAACRNNQLCYTVPKPINILLQRQPPAPTASFFQKMRFIIEEGSLQRYTKNSAFNESRVAVIRGQVVTSSGRGLVGVRITRAEMLSEGYTMTREDGWFDFMVNGGGAVTLKFGKSPFPPRIETLFAPWNEVIVIDPVTMTMNGEHLSIKTEDVVSTCTDHNYETTQPIVVASGTFGFNGAYAESSSVIAESQSLFETISIPSSKVKLVYSSPRSRGYLSTIQLQLTPDSIPPTLVKIYLRITIEGVLFEKIFEADPNLKYTYSWKGMNVYRQRVYGTTTAIVKVGYEYSICSQVIWNVQSTRISGQDLSVSNIGGWDLDIHHRYNFQEGILYKGDGTNTYLKETPALIFTTMGDGHRRPVDCSHCEGEALQQKLLSPVTIVSSPDGSLFVGDFNLIRKISPNGQVRTILQLNNTSVPHRYFLAVNPQNGLLYISDPEAHRIIQVINSEDPQDIENNWQHLIGSGSRCLPGDEDRCGDGTLARYARLIYPKGIAVSAEGKIYFADGTTIRMVDQHGLISTLIQSHLQNNHWKPLPCEGTMSLEDITLRWPTELAINPLDDSVHFIDDNIVMKVTRNGQLKVVAGRPLHCSRPHSSFFTNFAAHTTLASPQAMAFSPTGELYIAESDSRRINRISAIGTNGRINIFAGKDSKCNCQESSCNCFDASNHLGMHSLFRYISGITISPDGAVHICDQTNYRIRTIKNRIPSMNHGQNYEVHSPESQETYIFNRFGLHIATRSISTHKNIYHFAYSVSTSTGSLVSVTDSVGGKLSISRNYAGQVESIENAQNQKCALRVDRKHLLRSFSYSANNTLRFDYYRTSELLHSRKNSDGSAFIYEYDTNGRIEKSITPTGEIIQLKSDISIFGTMVNVTRAKQKTLSLLVQPSFVHRSVGHEVEIIQIESDRSFITESKWGHKFVLKTTPYMLLKGESAGLAERFPIPSIERTEVGKDVVNQVEWWYYANGNEHQEDGRVGKKLKVNGESILTVELDRLTGSESVRLDTGEAMVNITHSSHSMVINSMPSGEFPTITEEYNSIGLPVKWSMGTLTEKYIYDSHMRLIEVKIGEGSPGSIKYMFKESPGGSKSVLPDKIVIPSGGSFLLHHDGTGALQSILTPRGHIHTFQQQLSLGYYKLKYQAPWSREPYVQHFNQRGMLLAKSYPANSGKVLYIYDNSSHLRTIIGGRSSIHYHYISGTALVSQIVNIEDTFRMSIRQRHHRGALKESNTEFSKNSGLGDFTMKYQYDATGRLSMTTLDIIGQAEHVLLMKYDSKLGRLKGLSDLRISYRSPKLVLMEDLTKSFQRDKKYDEYGRFQSLNLIIKGQPLFRVDIEYNANSLISSKSVALLHKTTNEKILYNSNNQINMVKTGAQTNWVYTHDVNGNVVSVTEQGQRITLGYDSGDRVVQFGNIEFVTYDSQGFVIRRGEQRYSYDTLGRMTTAFEPGQFSVQFFYDDEDRLVGSQDYQNNFIQYIYGNPYERKQVTHIHYPKDGKTQQLFYDERNLMVAIESEEGRYYVATDESSSPLAVFDNQGKLVKQLGRTPFGRTMHDSNPSFDLPVDFHGGLINKHTRLVHFGSRVYDPVLGQWMTPAWEGLGKDMDNPFDIFVYRFMNNNPLNKEDHFKIYQDSKSWLTLMGLNLENIVGSCYLTANIHQPTLTHNSIRKFNTNPQINLAIRESYEQSRKSFLNPSFLPKPDQLTESRRRVNLSPRINNQPSIFGEGMLLSKHNKHVIVTLVSEAVKGVFQSVFSSVLNGAQMLELKSPTDAEEYFFLKDENQYRNDIEELERLSGSYNVTKSRIRGGHEQVCVKNTSPLFAVCIAYGAKPERALRQRQKQAHRDAVLAAWASEYRLVKQGFHGKWTPNEKDELLKRGEVSGYVGVEVHNVHKFPGLIGQSSNIKFIRETGASVRKL